MQDPDYNPGLDSPALDDAELQALDTLLATLPSERAMNLEALDGYLTALVAGPVPIAGLRSADWLPPIWGGAEFASAKQRKRAVVLVLRHLHSIDSRLRDDPDAWEPVLSVAETQQAELVDAEDWCIGFLQAVELAPEAWAALFDEPELGPLLRPLVLLGSDEAGADDAEAALLADPIGRDSLGRAAVDAVMRIHARNRSA
ncbi:MAG: UPF0149 family protein [Burkholderiales bacterium]|nr:UPF0149 family protein [Burkholderiales bacterium]MDE2395018.1 UPF0149 family protein [Burkholderiales bacterium]MDE2454557.1 UPF0149 family protein [Burkholderiales bacterium]